MRWPPASCRRGRRMRMPAEWGPRPAVPNSRWPAASPVRSGKPPPPPGSTWHAPGPARGSDRSGVALPTQHRNEASVPAALAAPALALGRASTPGHACILTTGTRSCVGGTTTEDPERTTRLVPSSSGSAGSDAGSRDMVTPSCTICDSTCVRAWGGGACSPGELIGGEVCAATKGREGRAGRGARLLAFASVLLQRLECPCPSGDSRLIVVRDHIYFCCRLWSAP